MGVGTALWHAELVADVLMIGIPARRLARKPCQTHANYPCYAKRIIGRLASRIK
jgi:hypothetical protein